MWGWEQTGVMRNRRAAVVAAVAAAAAMLPAGCGADRTKKAESEPARPRTVQAPAKYHARFETTKGNFVVEVVRDWAPRGADRFYELVTSGYYDGSRFYRVRPKFIVQWGIGPDPKKNELWTQLRMPDDPVKQSNKEGYITFAKRGPGTRTTQVFVNLANNGSRLDSQGFAPFGRVVEGMDTIRSFYAVYGEVQPLGGSGPDPSKLEAMGDEYAQRSFPRLDQIRKATVVPYTAGVEGEKK